MTLLTLTEAAPSTPASLSESPQQDNIDIPVIRWEQAYFPAQKQHLISLCAWYWSFEPDLGWQAWDMPQEARYDQMKQRRIKMSPVGSIPINLQAHHYPRTCQCLQLRTAASFAPPLLGLSWVTTINLSFARRCNDSK